jgi:hypothetical protein
MTVLLYVLGFAAIAAGFPVAGLPGAALSAVGMVSIWVGWYRATRRRPSGPMPSGCCGCGAHTADVVVDVNDGFGREGYCWRCITAWPADETVPPYTVLPGRERGGVR